MTAVLKQRHCAPCRGDVAPLDEAAIRGYLEELTDWYLAPDGKCIRRDIRLNDFAEALHFVNDVGAIAEAEGHHPDIAFGWGYVSITLQTHKIGGLHENDFILAAKLDALMRR